MELAQTRRQHGRSTFILAAYGLVCAVNLLTLFLFVAVAIWLRD
jgi:hypothetical protein